MSYSESEDFVRQFRRAGFSSAKTHRLVITVGRHRGARTAKTACGQRVVVAYPQSGTAMLQDGAMIETAEGDAVTCEKCRGN